MTTDNEPAAAPPSRPYSPVRLHAGVAYTAGHVPFDRSSGAIRGATVFDQTVAVLEAIDETLRAAGGPGVGSVLTFTVYLTDMSTIDQVDAAFRTSLTEPYPARTTIEVSALPRPEFLVEISAVAAG